MIDVCDSVQNSPPPNSLNTFWGFPAEFVWTTRFSSFNGFPFESYADHDENFCRITVIQEIAIDCIVLRKKHQTTPLVTIGSGD